MKKILHDVNSGKTLYLLIGAPFSGRKDLADNLNGIILATDDFFKKDHRVYNREPNKLKEAHKWNQERAIDKMQNGEESIIINNNNNAAPWEMTAYVEAAIDNGYRVIAVKSDDPDKNNPDLLYDNTDKDENGKTHYDKLSPITITINALGENLENLTLEAISNREKAKIKKEPNNKDPEAEIDDYLNQARENAYSNSQPTVASSPASIDATVEQIDTAQPDYATDVSQPVVKVTQSSGATATVNDQADDPDTTSSYQNDDSNKQSADTTTTDENSNDSPMDLAIHQFKEKIENGNYSPAVIRKFDILKTQIAQYISGQSTAQNEEDVAPVAVASPIAIPTTTTRIGNTYTMPTGVVFKKNTSLEDALQNNLYS